MSDWSHTVEQQAEQTLDCFEISRHNVQAVETLTTDPTYQELALAEHRASLAYDSATRDDQDGDLHLQALGAADDLREAMRDRAATLLLAEAFDVEGDR